MSALGGITAGGRTVPQAEIEARTEAEVARWFAAAKAGAQLVYVRGSHLPQGAAGVKAVKDLHDKGLVMLFQRREAPHGFAYIASKRAEPEKVSHAAGFMHIVRQRSNCGEQATDLLTELRRRANAGAPCGTNRELGRIIGVEDPDRVSYLLRKLIRVEKIRVETVPAVPIDERVIAIVASGKRTGLNGCGPSAGSGQGAGK